MDIVTWHKTKYVLPDVYVDILGYFPHWTTGPRKMRVRAVYRNELSEWYSQDDIDEDYPLITPPKWWTPFPWIDTKVRNELNV